MLNVNKTYIKNKVVSTANFDILFLKPIGKFLQGYVWIILNTLNKSLGIGLYGWTYWSKVVDWCAHWPYWVDCISHEVTSLNAVLQSVSLLNAVFLQSFTFLYPHSEIHRFKILGKSDSGNGSILGRFSERRNHNQYPERKSWIGASETFSDYFWKSWYTSRGVHHELASLAPAELREHKSWFFFFHICNFLTERLNDTLKCLYSF